MERHSALNKILAIAASSKSQLAARSDQASTSQSQPTPPRQAAQPKTPFPRAKPLKSHLKRLGLSEAIAKRLADVYRQRVVALNNTVHRQLKKLWINIQANPKYSVEEAKATYLASAEAILSQYKGGLKSSFDTCYTAVKLHFEIYDAPTTNGKFDERYVTVLEWVFGNKRYPSQQEKSQMAIASGLSYRQVSVWFQNRRARTKKRELAQSQDVTPNDDVPPVSESAHDSEIQANTVEPSQPPALNTLPPIPKATQPPSPSPKPAQVTRSHPQSHPIKKRRKKVPILAPVKLPTPKPVLADLIALGVPQDSSAKMSGAYEKGVRAAIDQTGQLMETEWRAIARRFITKPDNAFDEFKEVAIPIMHRLRVALEERYELVMEIVREHLQMYPRRPDTAKPKWDKRWVPLFVWTLETKAGAERYPNELQKQVLVGQSTLSYTQVSVWFQERRAREATGIDDPDKTIPIEDPVDDRVWIEDLHPEERLNAIKAALNRRDGDEPTLSELYEGDLRQDFYDGVLINPLENAYLPPHDFSFPNDIWPEDELKIDEWFNTDLFELPTWPRPSSATSDRSSVPFSPVNDDEMEMLGEALMEWRIEPVPRNHAMEDLIDYTSMLDVSDDSSPAPPIAPVPTPVPTINPSGAPLPSVIQPVLPAPVPVAVPHTSPPTSPRMSSEKSLAILRRGVGKRKLKPLAGKRRTPSAMAPPRLPLPYRGLKTALLNNIVRKRESSQWKKGLPVVRELPMAHKLHIEHAVHAAWKDEIVEEPPEPTQRPGPDPLGMKSYVFYHASEEGGSAGLSDDLALEADFQGLDEDIIPDPEGGCFELPGTFKITIEHYDDATEEEKSTVPFSYDIARVALDITLEQFGLAQKNSRLPPPGPLDRHYEIPPTEVPGVTASLEVSQDIVGWSNDRFNDVWKPEPPVDPAWLYAPRIQFPSSSPSPEDLYNEANAELLRTIGLSLPASSPLPVPDPLPSVVPHVDVSQDLFEPSAVPAPQELDESPAVPVALALLDIPELDASVVPASLVDFTQQFVEYPTFPALQPSSDEYEDWMQYINFPPEESTPPIPTRPLTDHELVCAIEDYVNSVPPEQSIPATIISNTQPASFELPAFSSADMNTHLSSAQLGLDDTGGSYSMARSVWSTLMDTFAIIPSSMSYAIDHLLGQGISNLVETGSSSAGVSSADISSEGVGLPFVVGNSPPPIEQHSEWISSPWDGTDFTGFFAPLAELDAANDPSTFELPQEMSFYGYTLPTLW